MRHSRRNDVGLVRAANCKRWIMPKGRPARSLEHLAAARSSRRRAPVSACPTAIRGAPTRGVDCIGLIALVCRRPRHPDDRQQGRLLARSRRARCSSSRASEQCWKPEDQSTLIPGDIACSGGRSRAMPQHFGIIGEARLDAARRIDPLVLEVRQGARARLERLLASKHFYARYIFPGTEEEWR